MCTLMKKEAPQQPMCRGLFCDLFNEVESSRCEYYQESVENAVPESVTMLGEISDSPVSMMTEVSWGTTNGWTTGGRCRFWNEENDSLGQRIVDISHKDKEYDTSCVGDEDISSDSSEITTNGIDFIDFVDLTSSMSDSDDGHDNGMLLHQVSKRSRESVSTSWDPNKRHKIVINKNNSAVSPYMAMFMFTQYNGVHKVSPHLILLDNGSTLDTFYVKSYLKDIRKADSAIDISTNGGVHKCDLIGDLSWYGWVYYNPRGIANILSMARLEEKGM